VIRVYDAAGNVIETREHNGRLSKTGKVVVLKIVGTPNIFGITLHFF